MGFTPILPGDDQPLDLRVRSLTAWCEGFLYGLSSHRELKLDDCSEAMQEIVGDLTEFTQASLATDDGGEVEESAYTELVEYLRVGVQIVYIEMRGGAAAQTSGQPTLH